MSNTIAETAEKKVEHAGVEVQKQVDKAGTEVQQLADKDANSTDSNVRYMAYASRLRTAVRAGSRYIAYTSDVGEAFRPMVPPWVVTGGYAISWLYLGGDVSYESYKAYHQGPSATEAANFSEPTRIAMIATKRALFQSIASMALPAFTIHTIVKRATKSFVNVKNPRLKLWGPTCLGLSVVPALPYLFDKPVEHLTDKAFELVEHAYLASKRREEELKVKKEL
ncbi:hypothetical protein FRB94_007990 [Tulasnella sp. JGI-2019a]|nr:hypothetical protein FRB93_007926 [Tulasnella sp. JGI-2019a]KAG8996891.1 hypothetical protein FRB94_007990 [Tulasnella sp. JGI-2019a]KAG9027545.1 hypothetical protein FRB95_007612 [Tulasnella sp. JGI-2019a]